jgi:hypothetical protein
MIALRIQYTRPLAGIAALITLAACSSDLTGGNMHPGQRSFTTNATVTAENATVSIDVSKWFLSSDGAAIDPTVATPGSSNQSLIENNIRRSFHAFEDDNERGEDHHEGYNGNDDGGHD